MRSLLFTIILVWEVILTTSCNQTTGNAEAQAPTQNQTEMQQRQVEKQEEEPSQYKGSFCTGENEFSPLTYTKEYKEDGDNFITVYKISSPDNGYYLNITATHYKSEKKIIVSIDDITVSKEFGHVSTQEITYEKPSLTMFGRPNIFRSSGMDEQGRLPNDLALQFTDSKFQYVNVINIVKDDQMDPTNWYVLDEKN